MTTLSPEAREVLLRARARIDTPEKWWPLNREGECASVAISEAVMASGADLDLADAARRVFREANAIPGGDELESIWDWNDARSHADVMQAFDKALAS